MIASTRRVCPAARVEIVTNGDTLTAAKMRELFAAGLTFVFAVQTFLIIGGILRIVPLTGITLPFMSYGGSALVGNMILIALLLRISHEEAR